MKKIIISLLSLALLSPTLFAAKVQAQNYQDKYKQVREQYQKEVNFYKNARKDFLKTQAKFQRFKNTENKVELEDAARELLNRIISSMIKRLESIKNWVENRGSLEDTDKQSIIAEINEDITWLSNKQASLDGMTFDEIKVAAKEVKDYWKNHRVKVKKITGQIFAARINYIINKLDNLSDRVESKIGELKADGHDTTVLEALLVNFETKIDLAKEKYEAAKTAYEQIDDLSDADTLLKQTRDFAKQAHQYIKEAHEILRKIIQEIKTMA